MCVRCIAESPGGQTKPFLDLSIAIRTEAKSNCPPRYDSNRILIILSVGCTSSPWYNVYLSNSKW